MIEKDVNHALDQKARSLSWLDMIFSSENNTITEALIVNDHGFRSDSNLGDHLLLRVKTKIQNTSLQAKMNETHKIVRRFNWLSYDFQSLYNRCLKHYLEINGVYKMRIDGDTEQESRTNKSRIVNNVHHAMISAFEHSIEKTTRRIKHKKNSPWWDETVKAAHHQYTARLREYNCCLGNKKLTKEELDAAREKKIK